MNYCCNKLAKAVERGEIMRAFFPSGIEYYKIYEPDEIRPSITPTGERIYVCPFCEANLV